MAGSVYDIETVVIPETGSSCRLDRDTPFLLLVHEVGSGSTVMDLTYFVDFAGQLKDALGGCGLTRIDVRKDSNVPVFGEIRHNF